MFVDKAVYASQQGSPLQRRDKYHATRCRLVSTPPTCAGLETLGPGVIRLCVSDISAVPEPSATASATAAFAGFLDSATLGTRESDHRRRRRVK